MAKYVVVVRVEAEVVVEAEEADDAMYLGLNLDGKVDVLNGEVLEVMALE